MLEAASIYGRSMNGKYAGFYASLPAGLGQLITGINTAGIGVAVQTAEDEARKWRNRIPLIGDGYIYRRNQNKEWAEVQAQVIRPYVEAAGLIGQRVVHDKAVRDLKNDLNPLSTDNLVKVVAIAGGAAVAFALINSRKGVKP